MAREIRINDVRINDESGCFVIAEIGHNHQGDIEKARQLIKAAQECGVDAVKFQKRDNRALYTSSQYNKPYENENSFGRTYGEHRENLELGWDEYVDLKAYAEELGVIFFATAFDMPSVDFLARLAVPVYKIASGDIKIIPLLTYVAKLQAPMIVSTGGCGLVDVQRAYDAIMPINNQLCLLQCSAAYPTPAGEMNLRVVTTLRDRFPTVVVGLSDHYNGIAMAVAAYVLGARVVEKHFTLNHTWKGTDQAMSLEPIGMQKMIRDLHRTRDALGNGVKQPLASEGPAITKMGKKLVAARDLPAGHVLTEVDIAIKSPGDGIAPYELEGFLYRRLLCPIQEDDNLQPEMLEMTSVENGMAAQE